VQAILTARGQAGFTIVELMIAITVVAILSAIGVPALRNFTLQQRIGTTVQELQLDVALARSEAITRAASVSLCTSSSGTGCTATGWEGGRIIFTDANQNGVVDGADLVLRQGNAPQASMTVTRAPAVNFVSFNRLGQANVSMLYTVCKTGLKTRLLTVRTSGNPSVSNPNTVCP
jgi:type IV fimbrial biogenesis protein FimT